MATTLIPTNWTQNGIGNFFDLFNHTAATARYEGVTAVVNAVSSGTEIQWTRTAGGTALEFITGRSPAGGWTLSGTVTFQINAIESAMTTNIGARARLFKRTAAGSETEVGGGPWSDGVEFDNASFGAFTWTGSPSSTSFAEDDRLIVRFYITNIGTMGTGTGSLRFGARETADTSVVLTETVAFKPDVGTFGNIRDMANTVVSGALSDPTAIGPLTVVVGDLIIATIFCSSATTVVVGVTDDLGNTYNALNNGANGTSNTVAYYSICSSAGNANLSIDVSSSPSGAVNAASFVGTFAATPLDVNTAVAADSAEPYAANATGGLAQASELIIGYLGNGGGGNEAYEAPTPSNTFVWGCTPGYVTSAVGVGGLKLAVSSSSSVSMTVGGSGGARTTTFGVATFKEDTGPPPPFSRNNAMFPVL